MEFIGEVAVEAWAALVDFGPELREVVLLTLAVSATATIIGCLIGIPLGVGVALGGIPGRRMWRVAVGVGMGMPPVLAGLGLLILFWRSGPLGGLGLSFTPTAMIIAQVLLAAPVAAGVMAGAIEAMPETVVEQLLAFRLTRWQLLRLAVGEGRAGAVSAVVGAFGRVIAEVGAVLVVGGNILGETRVLTTLIVQESRQGRFGSAVAAGVVLLVISLLVNLGLDRLRVRR